LALRGTGAERLISARVVGPPAVLVVIDADEIGVALVGEAGRGAGASALAAAAGTAPRDPLTAAGRAEFTGTAASAA
jgi:hypothetical protein